MSGLARPTSGQRPEADVHKASVADTLTRLFEGTQSRLNVASDSGFDKPVNRSATAAAKVFNGWGEREALPSIRKNGRYIKDQEKVATSEMTKAEQA